MQSTEMTAFGKEIAELMNRRGVSHVDKLAQMSAEAGFPFEMDELVGHMYDRSYPTSNTNVVRGPAAVFALDDEAVGELASAFMFNR